MPTNLHGFNAPSFQTPKTFLCYKTIRLESEMFPRITSDPAVLGGKPIVRGTRISVEIILEWIASGATRDEILGKHPQLTADDLEQALAYAAASVRNEVLLTAEVGA